MMASITFKGNPVTLVGSEVKVGDRRLISLFVQFA